MFDVYDHTIPSHRFPIIAGKGMVCTGHNLASSAGLEMLRRGGNAIDAAIATAAALTVVEPTANGLGSDAFAIVSIKGKLYGLNSSGCSPMDISIAKVKEKHGAITQMPRYGWTPVTVPGAVKAWSTLHERFGVLPFEMVLQPAIELAEHGFPLTPEVSRMWRKAKALYEKEDNKVMAEWFSTFAPKDQQLEPGEWMCLKAHAASLRSIAKSKGASFYEGELADQIGADSKAHGGFLRKQDLMAHQATWVTPQSVDYHGYDVWELPPNGQGIVALNALNILRNFQFTSCDEAWYHHQFEAMKMAFADGKHIISDPAYMQADPLYMLDEKYGKERAERIQDTARQPMVGTPYQGGTVYLCTADQQGNMVSYIQSNYMGFGSGVVVKDTGIALQNRGADFSLCETDANALQPGKRSYHTIIPGFLSKNGKAIGPFGVMGGYMQPQGHVQVMMNLIDRHLNPQMCLDAPRWQWNRDKQFLVEPSFDPEILSALQKRGHDIKIEEEISHFGRGQMILRMDNGVLIGGCESRTDSNIACF